MSLSFTRALLQTREAALEWAAQHHGPTLEAGARHFVQGLPHVDPYLARMALDFALLCPPSPDQDSVLERYIASRPALPGASRRILAALEQARLRVMRIEATEPGRWIEARDLLTDQVTRYAERSTADLLTVDTCLLGLTMRAAEGEVFEGVLQGVPPEVEGAVAQAVRDALAAQGVAEPGKASPRQTRATGWPAWAALAQAS